MGQEPSGKEVKGVIAFIGVGSNMGVPAENCQEAVKKLSERSGIGIIRCSSLYRTEPVGPKDQDWFINAVVEIRTSLSARCLLEALQEIERQMGRTKGPRWGPRVIDLDLLLYGREIHREEGLVIPHPELHRRAFVLVPLCEIASYLIHPDFGVSINGLMQRLDDTAKVEPCLGQEKKRNCGAGRVLLQGIDSQRG